ncbi:2-phosphosulfolactate phosphatase [Arthrobacter cupressi]|uniref:Probable 2-phosphosulfolactate phosphatase n=1 Tax=Arthrobacter cupressi TaxID=1045773 RepID=A0A1G8JVW8_9MICC|nr:2-phosphosulfolactate phosphatase [Arthrobacter cupressi]NYD77432.1 2-phosphosulfolactate phosphatase [Arthrobacter cupressi]SDI34730.1 2-phosphosulfolactate phosphatase [Arthrobacter cupressi]
MTAGAVHRQQPYRIRFEWGLDGARIITAGADLAVVVDVLSFTTCVSVAVERGVEVYPYRWKDTGAEDFAVHHRATLAGPRNGGGLSLSPSSLRDTPGLERVVLPSPNGSAICQELAGEVPLLAAVCLRNAAATADWVLAALPEDAVIAVIAAGELWHHGGPGNNGGAGHNGQPGHDGGLRPAVEDLWGAGAFLAGLVAAGREVFTPEALSPEALAAAAAFDAAEPALPELLRGCSSGRELIGMGYPDDVEIAAGLDAASAVAVLRNGAFTRV